MTLLAAPVCAMSKEMKPLSMEESRPLQELMARANTAGVEPGHSASSQWDMPTGSVTDASKRQRGAMSDDAASAGNTVVKFHPSTKVEKITKDKGQKPLVPSKGSSIPLPPSVSGLEDWGTTVCQRWLLIPTNMVKGPSVKDFFMYLQASGYVKIAEARAESLIPASRTTRKKK